MCVMCIRQRSQFWAGLGWAGLVIDDPNGLHRDSDDFGVEIHQVRVGVGEWQVALRCVAGGVGFRVGGDKSFSSDACGVNGCEVHL